MAVAFDASSTATGTGVAASWSHTCTGSDRILFVSISYDGALGDAFATGTYNGVAMTKVGELLAQQGLSHYRLVNPASGSHLIELAWTDSFVWAASAHSFTGAHATQTATATTSEAATGNTVTKNISSATGDMVVDALSLNAAAVSTTTPGANQTTNAVESEAAASATLCGMSHEAGGATVTMSWDWTSASTRNAHSAINIAAAAGGGLALDQEGFRFRNDDGSETTATWKAAQDTTTTLAADETFRLRALINATGDPTSKGYKIQYRRVGDASWRDIDTSG